MTLKIGTYCCCFPLVFRTSFALLYLSSCRNDDSWRFERPVARNCRSVLIRPRLFYRNLSMSSMPISASIFVCLRLSSCVKRCMCMFGLHASAQVRVCTFLHASIHVRVCTGDHGQACSSIYICTHEFTREWLSWLVVFGPCITLGGVVSCPL